MYCQRSETFSKFMAKLGETSCHREKEGPAQRSSWLTVAPKRRPVGGALTLLGFRR